MTQAIGDWNDYLWSSLEDTLTPLPKGSSDSKIMHALPVVYLFPGALLTGCFVSVARIAAYAASFFMAQEKPDPRKDFSAVCKDSRLWKELGDLQSQMTLGQGNPKFLFGAATATWQDSGAVNCPQAQWTEWEKQVVAEGNRSGQSANLYQLYQTPQGRKEITDRLHKLGLNSYRFSIDWSQIQPEQSMFDPKALQVYVNFCRHLRDEGIQPMVTLHHFAEPQWFHNLGSFEKEENIPHFVEFAKKVLPSLVQSYKGKPLVEYVCTINEPAIEAFSRYVRGAFSPGETFQFEKAGIFIKTALKAHMAAYDALKKIAPNVQLGIVHQRLAFEATNPLLYPVTRYLSRLVNEAALNVFRTGNFDLQIPFFCNMSEKIGELKTDFVGLQYYVRPLIGLTGSTSYYEPMTMMPFREDPEGLYEAILDVHRACKAPIIITENGISTNDDAQRSRYMIRALYAAQRAQEVIGQDNLRGYYVWSFCDNAEWDMGLNPQRFGAFALESADDKSVIAKEPKKGMDSFIKVANAWHEAQKHRAVA